MKLLPALPQIMLGITMLVIAAIVGTRDLGQMVFGSLTMANFGMGVIAGGSVALVATISDRIFQALSRHQAERLGLVGSAPAGHYRCSCLPRLHKSVPRIGKFLT